MPCYGKICIFAVPNLLDTMSLSQIEYALVLSGWVIALILGSILLAIKTPEHEHKIYYQRGKNILAMAILLFGCELLFQWLIRFFFVLKDPILSVSIYLFTFCTATLMLTLGVSTFFAPTKLEKRHSVILFWILGAYTILLAINYLLVPRSFQLTGIYIACALLFILNCVTTYMCYAVYRKTINDLRTYFSDVLADLMRWMLGIGLSTLLFLISAPIVCLCPKIVSIYQLALGIIVFIYAFVSIINFSFRYSTVATAFNPGKEVASHVVEEYSGNDDNAAQQHRSSLSASLQEVMQDKELRWQRKGGYRTSGITIEQAAHDMGTNRSYLSRYLNEVRHMTFYEWVAQMRIHEAQQIMLQNPDATIEQIAGQVGFNAASTFSTTFKKIVGISPVQWRSRQ